MNQLLAMRAFVRVIETGSFSRASDQLSLPRSTVSKLITDLEKHLGIKLIQRTTRVLTPTAEGLDYHRQALRLVAELDAMDNAVRGHKHKTHGHLRVDAPVSFATHLLIPALADFHAQYPGITVALGISDRAVNIIGDGVDCVIRAGKFEDMAMVSRPLVALEFVTCAAPSYLQRMGTPSSPEDLEQHHLRTGYFFAGSGKSEPLIFERGEHRYEVGDCAFSTNEGNGLKELLLAGFGVGQHFKSIVQADIEAGRLVPLLQDWSRPALPFHLLYPPNRHQNARLKVFIDWVIATFAVRQ
ncbi:LysR family transcriptional regulator [Pseudomonas sp. SZMC_28357]|uniref:LysR substrate-binding domain-containing protein n=1 Tax=Pseudomonas sp. SZMC_28357 TaxID=3074380 RepID=UPI002870DC01|nr:LysR family transcriptional regulator [Pseudomonas sp. SZMC_28357]MDR9753750.1 LysR family transcriptional regulator [Pseudomonas sp. SZMC_28357]